MRDTVWWWEIICGLWAVFAFLSLNKIPTHTFFFLADVTDYLFKSDGALGEVKLPFCKDHLRVQPLALFKA